MLHVHTSSQPLEEASTHLNTLLRDNKDKDVLLLLSGGSALALCEHIDTSLLGPHVTLSVLDERWTYEQADSNFTQLCNLASWSSIREQGATLIDPRPFEPENLQDTAKRFDLALKHWHLTHHDGVVIATMGIGADGHTAGILPHPEDPERFATLFEHTTTCVRGYTVAPEKNPHTKRMTVTLTYVRRHIDHAVVYVVGEEKRTALTRIHSHERTLHTTPAQILNDISDGHVYTDVVQ